MNRLKKTVSLLVLLGSWALTLAVAASSLYRGGTAGWGQLPEEALPTPLRRWWQRRQELVRLLETEQLATASAERQRQVLEQLEAEMEIVPLRPARWNELSSKERKRVLENLTVLLAQRIIAAALDYAQQDDQGRRRVLRRLSRQIDRHWLPLLMAAAAPEAAGDPLAQPLVQQALLEHLARVLPRALAQLSWTQRLQVGAFLVQLRTELQRRLGASFRLPGGMPSGPQAP